MMALPKPLKGSVVFHRLQNPLGGNLVPTFEDWGRVFVGNQMYSTAPKFTKDEQLPDGNDVAINPQYYIWFGPKRSLKERLFSPLPAAPDNLSTNQVVYRRDLVMPKPVEKPGPTAEKKDSAPQTKKTDRTEKRPPQRLERQKLLAVVRGQKVGSLDIIEEEDEDSASESSKSSVDSKGSTESDSSISMSEILPGVPQPASV
jgi:hypothetical protein